MHSHIHHSEGDSDSNASHPSFVGIISEVSTGILHGMRRAKSVNSLMFGQNNSDPFITQLPEVQKIKFPSKNNLTTYRNNSAMSTKNTEKLLKANSKTIVSVNKDEQIVDDFSDEEIDKVFPLNIDTGFYKHSVKQVENLKQKKRISNKNYLSEQQKNNNKDSEHLAQHFFSSSGHLCVHRGNLENEFNNSFEVLSSIRSSNYEKISVQEEIHIPTSLHGNFNSSKNEFALKENLKPSSIFINNKGGHIGHLNVYNYKTSDKTKFNSSFFNQSTSSSLNFNNKGYQKNNVNLKLIDKEKNERIKKLEDVSEKHDLLLKDIRAQLQYLIEKQCGSKSTEAVGEKKENQ